MNNNARDPDDIEDNAGPSNNKLTATFNPGSLDEEIADAEGLLEKLKDFEKKTQEDVDRNAPSKQDNGSPHDLNSTVRSNFMHGGMLGMQLNARDKQFRTEHEIKKLNDCIKKLKENNKIISDDNTTEDEKNSAQKEIEQARNNIKRIRKNQEDREGLSSQLKMTTIEDLRSLIKSSPARLAEFIDKLPLALPASLLEYFAEGVGAINPDNEYSNQLKLSNLAKLSGKGAYKAGSALVTGAGYAGTKVYNAGTGAYNAVRPFLTRTAATNNAAQEDNNVNESPNNSFS